MFSQRLHQFGGVLIGVVALVVASTSTAAVSGSDPASGTLNLEGDLNLVSVPGGCPPPPPADLCGARTITGPFPGLGQVAGTYSFLVKDVPPPCAVGFGKALAFPIHFTVAGKGALHAAAAEAPCVDVESIRTQTQTFTITGGTGIYAGASGSGTLQRVLGEPTDSGRYGQERWRGTLTVPGLEFDTTAPTLSGATARTVKAKKGAKSARVVFDVTARDDNDASVAVVCSSRSGSRFRIGKTKVTCDALDLSANAVSASFTITVKKGS